MLELYSKYKIRSTTLEVVKKQCYNKYKFFSTTLEVIKKKSASIEAALGAVSTESVFFWRSALNISASSVPPIVDFDWSVEKR